MLVHVRRKLIKLKLTLVTNSIESFRISISINVQSYFALFSSMCSYFKENFNTNLTLAVCQLSAILNPSYKLFSVFTHKHTIN